MTVPIPEPIARAAREPLLHFVALGAALFAGHALLNPGTVGRRTTQIDIGPSELAWITTTWTQQYRRPPTEAELAALVDDYVREEVLYREALAMGLDRDDIIIKRRMVQKMAFLSEDAATREPATRAELERYFAAHRERYRLPPRVTFTHVFFSTDRRGAVVRSDADRVLATLRRPGAPERAPELGDRFMLQYDFAARSAEELGQLFGFAFAESLLALPDVRDWQGPLVSSFGLHLVKIHSRDPGRMPTLAEVAGVVTEDLDRERRDAANRERFASLRARYTVRVDSATLRQLGRLGGVP